MKLLLDTHIILWALTDNAKLSKQAKFIISDKKNDIYYSSASIWELTIKHMAKPDQIHTTGSAISDLCRKIGYQMLPVADRHVKALETLVFYHPHLAHNDPFDRIMLAQTKADGLQFITHDSKFPYYREPCVILSISSTPKINRAGEIFSSLLCFIHFLAGIPLFCVRYPGSMP